MTPPLRLAAALALAAGSALAQPAAAPPVATSAPATSAPATSPVATSAPSPADSVAGSAAPANDQAAQDRIMTLVRARKCGSAKAEATRVGDLSLADQIEAMCGARSANPFPTKETGGGQGQRRGGRGG